VEAFLLLLERSAMVSDPAAARLESLLDRRGRIVCAAADDWGIRAIIHLLADIVTDPHIRIRLGAALGFCPAHICRIHEAARTRTGDLRRCVMRARDWSEGIAVRLEHALPKGHAARDLSARLGPVTPRTFER